MFRIKSRRIGKFTIKQETFEDNFDWIVELFSLFHIIPLRVEYKFEYSLYEYTAYSEDFDIVPEGEKVPTYKFELHFIDSVEHVILDREIILNGYLQYTTRAVKERKSNTSITKSQIDAVIDEFLRKLKYEVKDTTMKLRIDLKKQFNAIN